MTKTRNYKTIAKEKQAAKQYIAETTAQYEFLEKQLGSKFSWRCSHCLKVYPTDHSEELVNGGGPHLPIPQ